MVDHRLQYKGVKMTVVLAVPTAWLCTTVSLSLANWMWGLGFRQGY